MCVLSLKYEIFTSFSFFSFQNINLFSFGHLIKDGELLIKVSDQPPKKRYYNAFSDLNKKSNTELSTYPIPAVVGNII